MKNNLYLVVEFYAIRPPNIDWGAVMFCHHMGHLLLEKAFSKSIHTKFISPLWKIYKKGIFSALMHKKWFVSQHSYHFQVLQWMVLDFVKPRLPLSDSWRNEGNARRCPSYRTISSGGTECFPKMAVAVQKWRTLKLGWWTNDNGLPPYLLKINCYK